jgi:hypothetical protein
MVNSHGFMQHIEVLLFPLPVAICEPQSLPSLIGPLAEENCVTRHFELLFHSQMYMIIFLTYSESSWPDGSNHTNFGSLRFFKAEQSSFKDAKMIR